MEEAGKVLAKNPNNPAANLLVGDILLKQSKTAEARTHFDKFIVAMPKDPRGYAKLGLLYQMQRNNRASLEQFEKALSFNPDIADVLGMIAAIHLSNREDGKAVERIKAQIVKSPKNPAFHHILARTYLYLKDYKNAEDSLLKAIEIKPDFIDAYIDLGNVYAQKGDLDKAAKHYTEASVKKPGHLPPYMLLGLIYEKQGKTDEAIKNYKKALEINPKFAPAANNLAWLYAENNGNLDVALSLAETAKGEIPDNAGISDTLGWIYYKKQTYLKAVTHIKEAAEKQPIDAMIRYHLGMAYFKKGDTKLAKAELTQSLKLNDKHKGAEEARLTLKGMK